MVTLNITLLRWSTFSEKQKKPCNLFKFFWCIFIVIRWSLIIWITTTITKYRSKVSWNNERLNYTRDYPKVKINFCVPSVQGALWHLHKAREVSTRKVLCKLIEIVPRHFSLSTWHDQWFNPRNHWLGKARPAKSLADIFNVFFFVHLLINRG